MLFFTGYPSELEVAFLVTCLGLALGFVAAFGGMYTERKDIVRDATMWTGFFVTLGGLVSLIYIVATQDSRLIETPQARQVINIMWVMCLLLALTCIYEFFWMRKRRKEQA